MHCRKGFVGARITQSSIVVEDFREVVSKQAWYSTIKSHLWHLLARLFFTCSVINNKPRAKSYFPPTGNNNMSPSFSPGDEPGDMSDFDFKVDQTIYRTDLTPLENQILQQVYTRVTLTSMMPFDVDIALADTADLRNTMYMYVTADELALPEQENMQNPEMQLQTPIMSNTERTATFDSDTDMFDAPCGASSTSIRPFGQIHSTETRPLNLLLQPVSVPVPFQSQPLDNPFLAPDADLDDLACAANDNDQFLAFNNTLATNQVRQSSSHRVMQLNDQLNLSVTTDSFGSEDNTPTTASTRLTATIPTAASDDNPFHADDPAYGARPKVRKSCTPCRVEHRTCKDHNEEGICAMCLKKEQQSFLNSHPTPFVAKEMCIKITTDAYRKYKDARSQETGKGKPLSANKIAAIGKRQVQVASHEVEKVGRVKVTDRVQKTNHRRPKQARKKATQVRQAADDEEMMLDTPVLDSSITNTPASSTIGNTPRTRNAKKPKHNATEGEYARFFADADDDSDKALSDSEGEDEAYDDDEDYY